MSIRRSSGILLHVTSLPGPYGVGDLGREARGFAELISQAGFSLWQLLPLTPVQPVFGNSPYSSPSAFAGNPLMISPDILYEEGLLSEGELNSFALPSAAEADFDAAALCREELMAAAWRRFCGGGASSVWDDFERFRRDEALWLRDFALYSLLKKINGGSCWAEWPAPFAAHNEKSLLVFEAAHSEELALIEFTQFIFFRQLRSLSEYCAARGVTLMGDIPIYVAWDSADVWSKRELFDLCSDGSPRCVAGVPPDYFSPTGQRWGNPLYNWERMRADDFAWWRGRLRRLLDCCPLARIDHFRGLCAFWEIPASCETACEGSWRPALGREMLEAFMRNERGGSGTLPLVAEDLGIITDDVRRLMDDFRLPGMKVLMFAFGGDVAGNPYAPHNIEPRSVVYTGTHDNDTAAGWWRSATAQERENFALYAGMEINGENVSGVMTRMALSSAAELAVVPAQDILGLGGECRMNRPSQPLGNWRWRMRAEDMEALRGKAPALRSMNNIYGRAG
ncbi:MAG: 4-alpha-glucanotransferase [Synergistaceae bacterium]|nr:4-alpha-glucanotransferase [Synergistaceae bacterium]